MSHADHEWAREQIPAHLAGGLSAEERARLEAHLSVCAECIAEIDAGRRFERVMDDLFAPVRPKPGLEERVIRSLRTSPVRRPLPAVGRVVMGVAALVLLGLVGLVILEKEAPTWIIEGIASSTGRPTVAGPQAGAFFELQDEAKGEFPQGTAGAGGRWGWRSGGKDGRGPALEGTVPEFRNKELMSATEMAKALDRDLRRAIVDPVYRKDAEEADHNQTADEEDFKKAKGDSLDFVSDKPFKGKGTYDTIGGGLAAGRTLLGRDAPPAAEPPPPPADPAAPRPDDAVMALREERERGQSVYSYRDTAPDRPNLEANYFKPGEAGGKEAPKPETKPEPAPAKRPAASPTPAPPARSPQEAPPQEPPAPVQRKIIRSGEVEFEIDNFDSAVATVTKIAESERGFVATVNSDKLPNGKVRGVVVVRVPPENLDRLLLQLRGMGELKSQNIRSQDITKQYTDLESQLRAAKTMEERLIKIIQEGKGEIKDLLAAEKELGVWRTKIEQLTGEMRYYNNLVSLSTLTITLTEKEIRTPFGVIRTERVQISLEVEDVEKSHREALAAVAEAKGRVSKSELKQHAAGQFNAVLEFEVAPAASGPLRDRFKQLGTVAQLDVHTLEETEGGSGRAPQEIKVTQKDSRWSVSIYNLANIQPRETVQLNLACLDAEKAYRDALARAEAAGARIIGSNLNRQKNDQTTGTINFEVKDAEAGAVLADLRALGEVMRLTVTENPDTAHVTRSKRGFLVSLFAMGTVAPRETVTVRLAARSVGDAHRALFEAAGKAEARILNSQVNQGDPRNPTAVLSFEVRRLKEAEVEAALKATGETLSRTTLRAQDHENVIDSKVLYTLTVNDLANVPARESNRVSLAAKDVAAAFRAMQDALRKADAWIHVSTLNESDRQNVTAALTFDVRREQDAAIQAALMAAGTIYTRTTQRAPESAGALDTKARYELTVFDRAKIPHRETHVLAVEVGRVETAVRTFESLVAELKGRVVDAVHTQQGASGQQTSRISADVPLAASRGIADRLREYGTLTLAQVNRNPQAPENELATARLEVTFSNDLIISPESGPWANIKRGLSVSLTAGSYALMLIMVGVCFVLPVALVAWLAWKGVKKLRGPSAPAPTAAS